MAKNPGPPEPLDPFPAPSDLLDLAPPPPPVLAVPGVALLLSPGSLFPAPPPPYPPDPAPTGGYCGAAPPPPPKYLKGADGPGVP